MAEHVSDSILLERYVRRREEAAFVDLVKRHGPRVEGTCRRLLRNEHDIEDVFQATFLVLARKAAGIAWRESVGGWLCAVAHRLAMNARADVARHRRREAPFANLVPAGTGFECDDRLPEKYHPLADPLVEIERRDLRQVLDDELLHLPEKYRAPVVLCDLEGRTHQEAALELGWPSGSISRRLVRARALLRRRLVHRGVILATGVVGVSIAAFFVANKASHRDGVGPMTVHQRMTSLETNPDNGAGASNLVARFTKEQSSADLAQIIIRARQAAQIATELESYDPGRNRDEWRELAGATRRSSEQLVQTIQENNQLAMLAAAHRLDASCVKCHEVFRQ
jgi:RNA polymerase sigma factor (sigma-70 family)